MIGPFAKFIYFAFSRIPTESKPSFTSSKSTLEAQDKCMKSVQG